MSAGKTISDKRQIEITMGNFLESPLDKKNIASSYYLLGMVYSMSYAKKQEEFYVAMGLRTLQAIRRLEGDPSKEKEYAEVKQFGDILDGLFERSSLSLIKRECEKVTKPKWEYFLMGVESFTQAHKGGVFTCANYASIRKDLGADATWRKRADIKNPQTHAERLSERAGMSRA